MYLYQNKDWPGFSWDRERVSLILSGIIHQQGRLIGKMEGLGFLLQTEAMLQTMTTEVLKSNEIEGEILDAAQVRSSIARKLGMDIGGLVYSDRNVEGIVEVMLDATQKFEAPLTEERLFGWHSALFPTGRNGMFKIVVGAWRDNIPADPMQVVSGPMGKEKIHFEAPEAATLDKEMQRFLEWFNSPGNMEPIIKAAVAHLWFVTIHPFDDGNGRIGRTIADMLLTRADGIPQRFYSMSAQIRLERKGYYDILEKTQKGTLDITEWLEWFLVCLRKALTAAEENLSCALKKARYWEWLASKELNDRQKMVVNKMLDGFEGKLTTSKWAITTKCSHDTALRDIQDLIKKGVLESAEGKGRSSNYILMEFQEPKASFFFGH